MDEIDGVGRSGKRDRLARLARVINVLRAHPDGIRIPDIARRVDMSPRTVYRDLRAIEGEIGLGVWSEGGRWGMLGDEFLPPLKLTLSEAMAVVLSSRLMVRYADKYDPDLGAAFEKLEEGLPPVLRAHVNRTLDILSSQPRDERFRTHVRILTKAWAERRVVSIDYEPAGYERASRRRRATVRPYLIEPSLQTHALYLIGFDETRGALRTFKIERMRDVALAPRTFDPPEAGSIETTLRRAWDIIADQPPVEVVLRFAPKVAARVGEATWHPTQTVERVADGSLVWRATVSGTIEIRLWILSWGDDVEVVAPAGLRDDVADTHRRAAARYASGGATGTGTGR
ncbi:MAG TPA: WYL domain-containing transcriptional regulator [Candidatus Limnocylindrales bacterium]|nr:WYL domain-containing transcriptional regulator [Candidatus Limnocylindrales bacterium]